MSSSFNLIACICRIFSVLCQLTSRKESKKSCEVISCVDFTYVFSYDTLSDTAPADIKHMII